MIPIYSAATVEVHLKMFVVGKRRSAKRPADAFLYSERLADVLRRNALFQVAALGKSETKLPENQRTKHVTGEP